MDLDIDVKRGNQKSIVNLFGEIDVYTAPKLKEALLPLTKDKGHIIEVCLKNIDYMDSTGLGVFIHVLKSTKEHKSHLSLLNAQDRILRLFKITGLNEILDMDCNDSRCE